jgi:hypothetical protein
MNERDIHLLIDRFFEGETSNEEEKTLYACFNRKDIPPALEKYKSVFQHFEKLSSSGDTLEEQRFPSCGRDRGWFHFMPKPSRNFRIISTIAASFAVIIGLGIYKNLNDRNFDPYKGSYIIRNGVKITDPKTIRPEIERSLYRMAMQNELEKREIQIIDF